MVRNTHLTLKLTNFVHQDRTALIRRSDAPELVASLAEGQVLKADLALRHDHGFRLRRFAQVSDLVG